MGWTTRMVGAPVPAGGRGAGGPAAVGLLTTDQRLADAVTALVSSTGAAVVRWPGAPGTGDVPEQPVLLLLVGADLLGFDGSPPVPDGVPRLVVARAGGVPAVPGHGPGRVLVLPRDAAALQAEVVAAARDRPVPAADPAGGGPARPAPVLAVVGGCGGAGASTLAAGIALAADGQDLRTVLLDLDPLGGAATLLPSAAVHTVRATAWASPFQVPAPDDVSLALTAARAEADLVVVDLPRRALVDATGHVVLPQVTRLLVVLPGRADAVPAGARSVQALAAHDVDARLVVRGPLPAGPGPAEVAGALGLPLGAGLRPEPASAGAAVPAGGSDGPLARCCARLLAELRLDLDGVDGGGRPW